MESVDVFFPRVLVISHNAFNLQNNMGQTLAAFFQNWPQDRIAQLFFHDDEPDWNICNRYYKVTDFDVLRSFVGKSNAGIVRKSETQTNEIHKAVYQKARSRKPYQFIVRNAMWKIGHWYTEGLKEWIHRFKPEVIFFAAGGYSFAYKVAKRIGKDLSIPIVPYICDDFYYLPSPKRQLLRKCVNWGVRREIRTLIKAAPTYICISEQMKQVYDQEFGVNGQVVMTGTYETTCPPIALREQFSFDAPMRLCYMGRLGLGRMQAILSLADSIEKSSLPVKLFVYTTETNEGLLAPLRLSKVISLEEPVAFAEVVDTMRQCDVVLHIESFDEIMAAKTKYSISTKIPSMLATGVPILAIGPEGIASIQYLCKTKSAIVVTGPDEIAEGIEKCCDLSVRKDCLQHAREAMNNHDMKENQRCLLRIFDQCIKAWNW